MQIMESEIKTIKMKKYKIVSLMIFSVLIINNIKAQTIEQGKKFICNERFKSAKDLFQKIIANDPNNE